MIELIEELYPAFRWFLYDARDRFSAPITVFGPMRATIYVGQMYFVFNSTEHIRALTAHFDGLIRAAKDAAPFKAQGHSGATRGALYNGGSLYGCGSAS